MKDDEIRRQFSSAFPDGVPPKGARPEEIVVYRICTTGKVESDSFLPTYLESVLPYTRDISKAAPDCGHYSMSTYEKYSDADKALRRFQKRHPPTILAKGVTSPECGWVLRDKEIPFIEELKDCVQGKDMKRMKKSSHVHWWLYEEAEPHKFFQPFEEKEESI